MSWRQGTTAKTLEELVAYFRGGPAKSPTDPKSKDDEERAKRIEAGAKRVLADRHKAPQFRLFRGR